MMMKKGCPVIFGEVLYDVFEDGSSVLGGAPFNVAWHLQGFGLNPFFISRIGNDSLGKKILNEMTHWGMDASGIQIDNQYPTGQVKISLKGDSPQYEILSDQAYDFISPQKLSLEGSGPLYHGSLIERSPVSAETLRSLHRQCQGFLFIDLNLRSPWWKKETVRASLTSCRWLKMNDEEFSILFGEMSPQDLFQQLDLEMLLVSRGGHGALSVTKEGLCEVVPEFNVEIVDTVGAGDAMSAVILLGLNQGWSPQRLLESASRFASRICSQRGATLSDKSIYDSFLREWSVNC